MATFKDMIKKLTEQFQKTQQPMPLAEERMRRVQEAAKKIREELKPKS